MFQKLKRESSGYRSWVKCDEDKDILIEVYRRAEGIALDKASISKNAGQRNLAKLQLTSVCAKWAHNQKTFQTTIVNSKKYIYELLTYPGCDVTNLILPNGYMAWVS